RSAMRTPLRKRLGFADRSAETRTDRGTMARALMYAFMAGGAIALGAFAVSSGAGMTRAAIAAAVAWGASLTLLALYDELPPWSYALLTAAGTLLVEWQVYEGGRGAAAYAVLLTLPAAYSAHFLRKVAAGLELLLVV